MTGYIDYMLSNSLSMDALVFVSWAWQLILRSVIQKRVHLYSTRHRVISTYEALTKYSFTVVHIFLVESAASQMFSHCITIVFVFNVKLYARVLP